MDLPGALASEMERLAKEVSEPCVVAVVGEVKVGKSTFVNAYLGEDLAKVGTHETTATINYFSYGNPDENKPVRVHWRSGAPPTLKSRAFLDSLQGNDEETLKEAEGVDHLEYFLPNSYLKQITLVDTPGTGTVVKEHQERAEEFLLRKRLRERHHQETQEIRDRADAVIYLVGPVAKADDKEFLEGFQRATGGQASALNAIGVLSKIELYPDVVRRREELAEKTASQLKDNLNTVIPVGAGVQRALDRLLN
ncbi:MAG: dynamin family protein, partial [Pyrinomonadaceae bacterium]|nr:dynamin family protein [Pyrinomonadaceae bacterium]